MSLSDGFVQGLSTPVPVAGAGLPTDMTLYAGGPLDPLKEHEAKYKQLDRMRRMSDRQSAKMLAELNKAEHEYYGDGEERDLDKVSFVSSHPLLRREYLRKVANPLTSTPPVSNDEELMSEESNLSYVSTNPEQDGQYTNYELVRNPNSPTNTSNTPPPEPSNQSTRVAPTNTSNTPPPEPSNQSTRVAPANPSNTTQVNPDYATNASMPIRERERRQRLQQDVYTEQQQGTYRKRPSEKLMTRDEFANKQWLASKIPGKVESGRNPNLKGRLIEGDYQDYVTEHNKATVSGEYRTPTQADNTAYRRAMGIRDINTAYNKQLAGVMPEKPPEEQSYWDRTKGFFSDVGDSLKGVGARVARQGTRGLQQLANYGLRNSEFLEGLVDDDEEARIMASLAQSSGEGDRQFYQDQLRRFTERGEGYRGRTADQYRRMQALDVDDRDKQYQALRDMHLRDQNIARFGKERTDNYLTNRGVIEDRVRDLESQKERGLILTATEEKELEDARAELSNLDKTNPLAQHSKNYGGAFDMYYGRGDEAKRLGIRRLEEDDFGVMFGDAQDAYRRARDMRSGEDQVATDPKRFVAAKTIAGDTGGLSETTRGWMKENLPSVAETNDPVELGSRLQDLFAQGSPLAMDAVEMMGKDLGPQQMTKVLMAAMPDALTMGKDLQNLSDEEAIAYIENLPPGQQEQLDRFIDLSAKYIAPNMQGSQEGFGTRTHDMQDKDLRRVNRVRRATDEEIAQHGSWSDRALSYLPFNAQYIDESKIQRDPDGKVTGYTGDAIDTEGGWTGFGSGEGKWYKVPGSDEGNFGGLSGTLYFNPQTGEFNREWGPSNYVNEEELPSRYTDTLNKALQRAEDRILPTAGLYF